MTWIEREDSVGAGWRALSIDGYIPDRNGVENVYREVYPERKDKRMPRLVGLSRDIILKEAIDYIRPEFETSLMKGMKKKRFGSYCHSFLLKFDREKKVSPPFTYLFQEFLRDQRNEDYRQILVFQKGCSHMKACTENLVERMDIRLKEENEYMDYQRFVKHSEQLIDNIFEVYVVPCIVAEDRLRKMGFECAPL